MVHCEGRGGPASLRPALSPAPFVTFAFDSAACLVNETNPLTPMQRAAQMAASRCVDWDTPGLRLTRLRLVSDPGYPVWDVSYCFGSLNGEPVEVRLPFSQLPKRGMRRALYRYAKASGRFIPGLFDAISTLQ